MTKGMNEFLGWGLFLTGATKLIYTISIYFKMMTVVSSMFSGNIADVNYYPAISTILGLVQLLLALFSIIMIFANINKCPGVIKGYLIGLLALLMELVVPSFILFYIAVVECGLYMKAGSFVRKANEKSIENNSKDMEWFYNR